MAYNVVFKDRLASTWQVEDTWRRKNHIKMDRVAMIRTLMECANVLDEQGMVREAEVLDAVAQRVASVKEAQMMPMMAYMATQQPKAQPQTPQKARTQMTGEQQEARQRFQQLTQKLQQVIGTIQSGKEKTVYVHPTERVDMEHTSMGGRSGHEDVRTWAGVLYREMLYLYSTFLSHMDTGGMLRGQLSNLAKQLSSIGI